MENIDSNNSLYPAAFYGVFETSGYIERKKN